MKLPLAITTPIPYNSAGSSKTVIASYADLIQFDDTIVSCTLDICYITEYFPLTASCGLLPPV